MKINDAFEVFFIYLRANSKSHKTIALYRNNLNIFQKFMNNAEIGDITQEDIERFMVYLQDEYVPKRKSKSDKPLSSSSMRNHWNAIRVFFRWAFDKSHIDTNPSLSVDCPPENYEQVSPLSEQEINALLSEIIYCKPTITGNRKKFVTKRRTALRDKAMVYVLLESGIRVGELCRLTIADLNIDDGKLHIIAHGPSDRKTKSRDIYLTETTLVQIKNYLSERKAKAEAKGIMNRYSKSMPLFTNNQGESMTPNGVRLLFADLGKKAGISNLHPHRFRHTYAIEFLRNDGNIYTLQAVLGHSDMKMCKTYLNIARADVLRAQTKSSPVVGWGLAA